MKNFFPLLFGMLLLASCQKEPSSSQLDNDFVVFTNHSDSIDFSDFDTYYLPDSVLLISNEKATTYWTGTNSEEIIDVYATQMTALGYTRVANKADADLGLQVSYIEDNYAFANYTGAYWWGGYPYYWTPGYWGGWYDWYYPYPVYYSYNVGSMIADIVDLDENDSVERKLPVLWSSYMTGLLSGNNKFDLKLTLRAIEQSFTQSASYLK